MRRINDISERTDHIGHIFESIPEMCDYWGMSHTTYLQRVYRGLSKKEALETPLQTKNKTIENPYTGEIKTVFEFARDFNQYRTVWVEGDIPGTFTTGCQLIDPDKCMYNYSNRGYAFEEVFTILPSISNAENFELMDGVFILKKYANLPALTSGIFLSCYMDNTIRKITKEEILIKYRNSDCSKKAYDGWLNYYRNMTK